MKEITIYPRGFSNTLVIDRNDNLLLQFRDNKTDIYPGHLNLWGGGHKLTTDPKYEAVRELVGELPKNSLPNPNPTFNAVYLMSIDTKKCPGFEGYTHFINYIFVLEIDKVEKFIKLHEEGAKFEGTPKRMTLDDFFKTNRKVMSDNQEVVRHIYGQIKNGLVYAPTARGLIDKISPSLTNLDQIEETFEHYA